MSKRFENKIAWFSNSVPENYKLIWEREGGAISEQAEEALYLFSEDAQSTDTIRLLSENSDVAVFKCAWITERNIPIEKFILLPPQVQAELSIYKNGKEIRDHFKSTSSKRNQDWEKFKAEFAKRTCTRSACGDQSNRTEKSNHASIADQEIRSKTRKSKDPEQNTSSSSKQSNVEHNSPLKQRRLCSSKQSHQRDKEDMQAKKYQYPDSDEEGSQCSISTTPSAGRIRRKNKNLDKFVLPDDDQFTHEDAKRKTGQNNEHDSRRKLRSRKNEEDNSSDKLPVRSLRNQHNSQEESSQESKVIEPTKSPLRKSRRRGNNQWESSQNIKIIERNKSPPRKSRHRGKDNREESTQESEVIEHNKSSPRKSYRRKNYQEENSQESKTIEHNKSPSRNSHRRKNNLEESSLDSEIIEHSRSPLRKSRRRKNNQDGNSQENENIEKKNSPPRKLCIGRFNQEEIEINKNSKSPPKQFCRYGRNNQEESSQESESIKHNKSSPKKNHRDKDIKDIKSVEIKSKGETKRSEDTSFKEQSDEEISDNTHQTKRRKRNTLSPEKSLLRSSRRARKEVDYKEKDEVEIEEEDEVEEFVRESEGNEEKNKEKDKVTPASMKKRRLYNGETLKLQEVSTADEEKVISPQEIHSLLNKGRSQKVSLSGGRCSTGTSPDLPMTSLEYLKTPQQTTPIVLVTDYTRSLERKKRGEKLVADFTYGSFTGFAHIDDLELPPLMLSDFNVNTDGCQVKLN